MKSQLLYISTPNSSNIAASSPSSNGLHSKTKKIAALSSNHMHASSKAVLICQLSRISSRKKPTSKKRRLNSRERGMDSN
jgi:hypothetical protein